MTGVVIRRGKDIQRHREEEHVATEAETGVMPPQAKECEGFWQQQKLGEKHAADLTLAALGRTTC